MESSPESLVYQIRHLAAFFPVFQIDVTDGTITPNKTPLTRDLIPLLDSIPFALRERITFDYHLMTSEYEREIADIVTVSKKVQVRNILIHSELSPNYYLLAENFPQFTFGAVLNSEDNVYEVMKNYEINSFPIIQFMTVHIGYQGNPFIEEVLTKIEQLRKTGYRGKIFVDGGINKETLMKIFSRTFLPDVLCIGSYLTHSDNVARDAEYLFDLLRAEAAR